MLNFVRVDFALFSVTVKLQANNTIAKDNNEIRLSLTLRLM